MPVSGHKYVIVLGSCCTGDALRSSSYEAIATTKLRLLLYQGRTSFPSLTSGGLANDEYSLTAEGVQALKTEWGFRMAVDEAVKQNAAAIAELVNIADALIVDHVSTFLFPLSSIRARPDISYGPGNGIGISMSSLRSMRSVYGNSRCRWCSRPSAKY